jgi:phosphatidylserine decarboxylase
MERALLIAAAVAAAGLLGLACAHLFWRYYWFWRNPRREVPRGEHFLSPADGTVVYVKRAAPSEAIIVCKQGQAASINDIVRDELDQPKILIGIFMSPFSVHYNRTPLDATLVYKRQYPAEGKNHYMGSMHRRSILGRLPIYANSPHIIQNNRAVSRWRGQFRGQDISCYLVQIGGGSVHGIDVYPEVGQRLEQGEIFGMIRIGSQVDLIVPDLPGLSVNVAPGDRVVAGETILIA